MHQHANNQTLVSGNEDAERTSQRPKASAHSEGLKLKVEQVLPSVNPRRSSLFLLEGYDVNTD